MKQDGLLLFFFPFLLFLFFSIYDSNSNNLEDISRR
jgi:hypothetical protein